MITIGELIEAFTAFIQAIMEFFGTVKWPGNEDEDA